MICSPDGELIRQKNAAPRNSPMKPLWRLESYFQPGGDKQWRQRVMFSAVLGNVREIILDAPPDTVIIFVRIVIITYIYTRVSWLSYGYYIPYLVL
jgi:hypothetical protein